MHPPPPRKTFRDYPLLAALVGGVAQAHGAPSADSPREELASELEPLAERLETTLRRSPYHNLEELAQAGYDYAITGDEKDLPAGFPPSVALGAVALYQALLETSRGEPAEN